MFKKPTQDSLSGAKRRRSPRRVKRNKHFGIERLEDRRCLSTDVQLLANFNQTNPWSQITEFASAGDYVYFVAAEANVSQLDLWRTDGTTAGTLRLTAVGPDNFVGRSLTNVNGTLYFAGHDSEHGTELWKSDGTVAGTKLVRDLTVGVGSSRLANFEPNGNELLFTRNGNLMRSNGAISGTTQVFDFLPNAADDVSQLERVGESIYVKAKINATEYRVYKTDGTASGTVAVRVAKGSFDNLRKIGDSLYFTRQAAGPTELWKTEGDSVVAKLVVPNFISYAREFTDVNGTLYFSQGGRVGSWDEDGYKYFEVGTSTFNLFNMNGVLYFAGGTEFLDDGYELWKSDGTTAGTLMVKDIDPGFNEGYGFSSNPGSFTNLNGELYFGAAGGIWKTDGTNAGTIEVESRTVATFAQHNGSLFLSKQLVGTPSFGLMKREPTASASVEVKRNGVGAGDANPTTVLSLNGNLYFGASDGVTGAELWRYNPVTEAATLVKDIVPGQAGSNARTLAAVNGAIYFSASAPATGNGLWISDGTTAGTRMLTSVTVMNEPERDVFTAVGNDLFFRGYTESGGVELWKTDGTASGTLMVSDLFPGSTYLGQGYGFAVNSSSPAGLTQYNGTLYFSAFGASSGRELWKSDGTASGTVLVSDLRTGGYYYYGRYGSSYVPNSSWPRGISVLKGQLHFMANDAIGEALWRTDGSTDSVARYKRFNGGGSEFELVNNELYFNQVSFANNLTTESLWKTDGTAAGTVLVKELRRASGQRSMQSMTNAGGTLYFVANDGLHGKELWRSDGTTAGTVLVADIRTGQYATTNAPRGSEPRDLTFMNGVLFFTADNGIHGRELWRTNGTADGAILVNDLNAGSKGSDPVNLSAVDGKLYFSAATAIGKELWVASSIAPRLRQVPGQVEYTQSSNAVLIAPNAIVSDADTAHLLGGRLVVRFDTPYIEGDRFVIKDRSGIRVIGNDIVFGEMIVGKLYSNAGKSLAITLNLNATLESVTKIVQAIAFRSDLSQPTLQSRRVTIQLQDGEGAASSLSTVAILLTRLGGDVG